MSPARAIEHTIAAAAVLLWILLLAWSASVHAQEVEPEPQQVTVEIEGDGDVEVEVRSTDGMYYLLEACDSDGGRLDAGPIGARLPSYPCEIARTYAALEEMESRGGFLAGSAKFFLRVRLFTRGIFSAAAGIVGLG